MDHCTTYTLFKAIATPLAAGTVLKTFNPKNKWLEEVVGLSSIDQHN